MAETVDKRSKTVVRTIAVTILLTIALCAIATPVSAAHELIITDHNLNVLRSHASWTPYSYGELMLWPNPLDVTCQKQKMVGSIRAVSVDDNQCTGWYYGECVSFAKALSKSNVVTTGRNGWKPGVSLFTYNLIVPGTVIATFGGPNGQYRGHTAIFTGEYVYSNGRRVGIKVWDQNYLPSRYGVVAKHSIRSKGTTYPADPTNANNYYTVVVP